MIRRTLLQLLNQADLTSRSIYNWICCNQVQIAKNIKNIKTLNCKVCSNICILLEIDYIKCIFIHLDPEPTVCAVLSEPNASPTPATALLATILADLSNCRA